MERAKTPTTFGFVARAGVPALSGIPSLVGSERTVMGLLHISSVVCETIAKM